jgi:5'-methylthioadenosine phosphorylase
MTQVLIDTQGKPLSSVDLAVIGGSGLYQIDSLREVTEVEVDTPFGKPSDLITVGRLGGLSVAFLPRHARGHKWLPSEINYRANIWALKKLGARFILSVSAVGSLQEEVEPGHLVCPDQFIDRTYKRDHTFFGQGIVGHISFGDPVDPKLSNLVFDAATEVTTTKVHRGGTYVCIEGPTFSTRAESLLFKAAGARIVGMTNLPEARLAREAEIAYATLALSTDYDCWHADHDEVSVASVLEVMKANIAQARGVIVAFAAKLEAHLEDDFMAHSALGGGTAIMTHKSLIPNETLDRVALLFGAYLKS